MELARKGEGWTSPNPMVGAVIVKEGRVIGEGYHTRCGGLHAERQAIASLRESAKGATLYVTLEPCCHHGKTLPCTEAILEQGIGRVVIGSRDPNPLVAGKGAAMLRAAGVQVEEDFLREECDRLNPVFFHYITRGTPYVVMKYAMTADGKIAARTGASRWVTGEAARREVQKLRHRYRGIMVGIGTVLTDDPMLNCRLEGKRSPVRIVCDSRLRIPLGAQLCRTAREYPTIVACAGEPEAGQETKAGPKAARVPIREPRSSDSPGGAEHSGELRSSDSPGGAAHSGEPKGSDSSRGAEHSDLTEFTWKRRALEDMGVTVVSLPGADGRVDLRALMAYLGRRGIDSVLLEGGGALNESVLRAGIVQEVKIFLAPKLFGGAGAPSPVAGSGVDTPEEAWHLELERMSQVGEDVLLEYRVREAGSGGRQSNGTASLH